jgi:hypothetical protein
MRKLQVTIAKKETDPVPRVPIRNLESTMGDAVKEVREFHKKYGQQIGRKSAKLVDTITDACNAVTELREILDSKYNNTKKATATSNTRTPQGTELKQEISILIKKLSAGKGREQVDSYFKEINDVDAKSASKALKKILESGHDLKKNFKAQEKARTLLEEYLSGNKVSDAKKLAADLVEKYSQKLV